MGENNKLSLKDAMAKIEALTAENAEATQNLATAQENLQSLQAKLDAEGKEHLATKAKLEAAESKNRDVDKEVSAKLAFLASKSGLDKPVPSAIKEGEETLSIEEIEKKMLEAKPEEKAALYEKYEDQILKAMKGLK